FLYDTNITVLKLALSKLFVNIFVNIGMGSLWSAILFSKGYIYYLIQSTIKNIVLLPFEIILLTIVFNLLLPYLIKKGFIKDNPIPIKLF
ncbi:MAG: folate family ECF transporter S component, partial [Erysipelotrichaceae bacterium]